MAVAPAQSVVDLLPLVGQARDSGAAFFSN
jgi:hypothetical protein